MIEDPQLLRDVQTLLLKPEFHRLKRYVFVAFNEGGQENAEGLATEIATTIRDAMLQFNPETGP